MDKMTLNEWAAKEIMGYKSRFIRGYQGRPFQPETNHDDVFQVVDKISDLGYFLTLSFDGMSWIADFHLCGAEKTDFVLRSDVSRCCAILLAIYKIHTGAEWTDNA